MERRLRKGADPVPLARRYPELGWSKVSPEASSGMVECPPVYASTGMTIPGEEG